MRKRVPTGLSLPIEMMQKIENDRGDVSRSRYLLRLLEKASRIESEKLDQKMLLRTGQGHPNSDQSPCYHPLPELSHCRCYHDYAS